MGLVALRRNLSNQCAGPAKSICHLVNRSAEFPMGSSKSVADRRVMAIMENAQRVIGDAKAEGLTPPHSSAQGGVATAAARKEVSEKGAWRRLSRPP
jgi:hypothetical protein